MNNVPSPREHRYKCQKRFIYARERLIYMTNAKCIYDNKKMSKETYVREGKTRIRDKCHVYI